MKKPKTKTYEELHAEYLRCVNLRKAKDLKNPPFDADDDSGDRPVEWLTEAPNSLASDR